MTYKNGTMLIIWAILLISLAVLALVIYLAVMQTRKIEPFTESFTGSIQGPYENCKIVNGKKQCILSANNVTWGPMKPDKDEEIEFLIQPEKSGGSVTVYLPVSLIDALTYTFRGPPNASISIIAQEGIDHWITGFGGSGISGMWRAKQIAYSPGATTGGGIVTLKGGRAGIGTFLWLATGPGGQMIGFKASPCVSGC